jgi:hypothetical protein
MQTHHLLLLHVQASLAQVVLYQDVPVELCAMLPVHGESIYFSLSTICKTLLL